MGTVDRELTIAALAATNGGYVTVADALSAGFTRSEIRTRVRNGGWDQAGTGLIRLPDHESADLWRDRVTKALTATQMGAVAARYTAARLLTIAGAPTHAPIEVAVPPDCHPAPRPGIRPLRTLVGQSELAEVDGIVTTGPLRTVLDCARYGDPVAAVCLLESATRLGLVNIAAVTRRVAEIHGERGSVRACGALRQVDLRSESPLETRIRLLLVAARLPYPELQLDCDAGGSPARIDLAYLASGSAYRGLAIEADGRETHARAEAFHRDPLRQTALEEDGWLFRRFTDRHADISGYVVQTVRRALDRLDRLDRLAN
jgi:hypothetical protein